MSASPFPILPEPAATRVSRTLPDFLPVRMVNEFAYCPRLFFLEWVEGLFAESADVVEGRILHRRTETGKPDALPPPEDLEPEERIHSRSILLSSPLLRVIAKIDLIESDSSGKVTPVDYKHGKPRETEKGLELWASDRAQLGLQILILRENGYQCDEAIAYYAKTRQRVRLSWNEELRSELETTVAAAWQTAQSGEIPPPLEDSPKCPGCSLVGICLPDETRALMNEPPPTPQIPLFPSKIPPQSPPVAKVDRLGRQLIAPRDDLRPVYLNTQGLRLGKSGQVLQAKDKDTLVQEIRLNEICQLNVFGNVQITTQAIQALCEAEIPICYFSQGGWFYGITNGLNQKNIFLRRKQFRLADSDGFCLNLAGKLVSGKIRNQRTMLQRNHIEPDPQALAALKRHSEWALNARSMEELLGIEGNAARIYFQAFQGMLKSDDHTGETGLNFDFNGRNRRPPRDPVNALLSLAYSVLTKDLTITCYAVGFDPFLGFYHQPRFGRPALALDLMEPFRPLIAESAVLNAINTKMVTASDFVRAGSSVALTPAGRKGFFRAYELRMDTLVTHPLFNYRVTYRRLLEIQARLLARYLEGEIADYPVFVTR
ncbi:MAG: CRISPR-associated endonuclease Cas1 [Bryobacteraceae bacterium]|nr:CRISPR-associated endonuclease Cas1 [Bryobacteraceae bacterium]MDW8376513.1 CRISPR-associated endonuclease Cas1 [Bryobacterales bacterium]